MPAPLPRRAQFHLPSGRQLRFGVFLVCGAVLFMQVLKRLQGVQSHLPAPLARTFSSASPTAAAMSGKFDLNSKVRLPSGYDLPRLGYGVYQTPPDVTYNVTSLALKAGYRHVDSAQVYRNEAESSKAVVDSGIPREEVFFTTKVSPGSISGQGVRSSMEDTIAKTKGLGYIDLVLLHAPYGGKENRLDAWDALQKYVESGQVRSIGVSNYGVHHLQELEDHIKAANARKPNSGGVLSVNQVELHPFLARPDIREWCEQRGVVLEAWGPMMRAKRFGDPRVKKVMDRVGKTEAQVLLRWSLQMGYVPLPKSVTPSRIIDNTKLFDFELSAEDMKTLDTGMYAPDSWDPTKYE